MSSDLYDSDMTDALDTAIDHALRALAEIEDPVERFRVSRQVRISIERGSSELKATQAAIVNELKPGRSWREVGELLDVSGSRADQISRGK